MNLIGWAYEQPHRVLLDEVDVFSSYFDEPDPARHPVGSVAVIYLLHFSAEALIFLFVVCAAASIPFLVRHIGRLQDDQIQRDQRSRARMVGEIQRNHPPED
jgi:hypothetical protein